MGLTLNQKAELSAIAEAPGAMTTLGRHLEADATLKSLVARGLAKWGKVRHGMREFALTPKGTATVKRFKKNWWQVWDAQQPRDPD